MSTSPNVLGANMHHDCWVSPQLTRQLTRQHVMCIGRQIIMWPECLSRIPLCIFLIMESSTNKSLHLLPNPEGYPQYEWILTHHLRKEALQMDHYTPPQPGAFQPWDSQFSITAISGQHRSATVMLGPWRLCPQTCFSSSRSVNLVSREWRWLLE